MNVLVSEGKLFDLLIMVDPFDSMSLMVMIITHKDDVPVVTASLPLPELRKFLEALNGKR